ncbi:MAG: ABC transporter substrate-binding protein [Acidimicrobiales bacterium]
MTNKRWQRALAAGVVLAGVAAACGSDSEEEAGGGTTTAKAAEGAAAGSGAAVNLPNTVVGENPSTWGVKDKKLTGPGGFTIDLSKCPANWNDKAGITDTEIRLGASGILSGSAASASGYVLGAKAYFDHFNASEGGINGKKLVYEIKDSGYEAGRGKAGTDELIETGNIFSFVAHTGTPIILATYDKLNESCMPNVYGVGAHPAQADPVLHPWTTGTWLGYDAEANLWADYILEKYGKGATVAALAWANDYGTIYKNTFTKAAKDRGLNFVKVETHEGSAPTVQNEMTTLASTNADVFIIMTGAVYSIGAVQYLANSTYKPKERLTSSVNNVVSQYKAAGAGGDGWIHTGYAKDVNDPSVANEPFAKQFRDILVKAGLDPTNPGQNGQSAMFAWPFVENLKRASQLPGGLSRTNLMLAIRSYSAQHPMVFDGIKFEMNGTKDPHPIEGASFLKYTVPAGQETGSFVPIGKIVDQNGKNGPCQYDGKECK